MNKQTSISLHLARVMGKEHTLHTYPDGRSQAVLLCFDDGSKQMWWPENNLHQWAECVLWAAMNGLCPMIDSVSCWAAKDHKDTIISVCENTQSSIQAATLEAIALATSWEESK